MAKADIKKN